MGRKLLVEFDLCFGDLSFHKDILLVEHVLYKNSAAFAGAKIIKPQEHTCRTPHEIQDRIDENSTAGTKWG